MNQDEKIVQLLEDLVKWTKVTSIPRVKELLLEILENPEEKIVYQSSNGEGSMKVAKLANVSHVTVTKWWKKWIKAGIAVSISVKGGKRAKRIFSLDDFGIEVPIIKKPKIEKEGEG